MRILNAAIVIGPLVLAGALAPAAGQPSLRASPSSWLPATEKADRELADSWDRFPQSFRSRKRVSE